LNLFIIYVLLLLLLGTNTLQLASLHFLHYLLSLRLYPIDHSQPLSPLPPHLSFLPLIFKYLPDLGVMKENLLAAGEKYCVVMCSYQTLEYLKELTLVLGLDKPIAVSLVEGTGETIDEDESDKEEEGEPD